MQFSLIVFGVTVITAPRGADCASKANNPRERLIPEHAETSNTEEIKYLKSVWDTVESWRSWRYSETAALAELKSYGLLYYSETPFSNRLGRGFDSASASSLEQVALWQTTLEVRTKVIRDLLVAEKRNSAERYNSKMGWNLAKPRWDETERARTVKRESFNAMQVELKKESRREIEIEPDCHSVVFEGTIGNNRKVIVEYTTSGQYEWIYKSWNIDTWFSTAGLEHLLRNFWVLETLDRLNMKGLAPVPVGLSSPAIAPDVKVCRTDDRLVPGQCSLLIAHSWLFRGLVTEPLLDETNNNIAKLADEFLADRKKEIEIMTGPEKNKMQKQVFIDIIEIGGLIVDALKKLHEVGFIYRPNSWFRGVRVAKTTNKRSELAVQLVDFTESYFFPTEIRESPNQTATFIRFRERALFAETPGTMLGKIFARRDDIYQAIQFVAQMLGSFNPQGLNSLHPFLVYKGLYRFKRYGSLFLDVRDLPSTKVDYDQGLGSKRIVKNTYCSNFGLSSAKEDPCVTALEHLDEALLRIQFIDYRFDQRPQYERIKESLADALIAANRLLNE